jgi:hypothetical protein
VFSCTNYGLCDFTELIVYSVCMSFQASESEIVLAQVPLELGARGSLEISQSRILRARKCLWPRRCLDCYLLPDAT